MTPNCQSCAACCRGKHHAVVLRADEMRDRPDLVEEDRSGRRMLRVLDDCVALTARTSDLDFNVVGWTCSIYADRPKVCRDFEPGSRACAMAREMVRV